MASKLEKIVREMDDEAKSITENARAIANRLNVKGWKYIRIILSAKRRRFNSTKDYFINNFKKRGFNSWADMRNSEVKKKNFKDLYEYQNYISQRNGFLDIDEYNNYIYHKLRGKFKNQKEFQEREGLLEGLEYHDPEKLDNFQSDKNYSQIDILEIEYKKEEIKNLLEKNLGKLGDKYREVIIKRFYEGKTLEEIGKEKNKSRARAGQIENEALKKLYFIAKQSGLYDLYIDR